MTTLSVKDLFLNEPLNRNAMMAIHGGRIKEDRQPKPPIDASHGAGGTGWEDGGMRGMHPTFAVDGSPAPIAPY